MNLPVRAFEPSCSWSRESHTRNVIVENEKFELGQHYEEVGRKAAIHIQGDKECWIKVNQGMFREVIYLVCQEAELD